FILLKSFRLILLLILRFIFISFIIFIFAITLSLSAFLLLLLALQSFLLILTILHLLFWIFCFSPGFLANFLSIVSIISDEDVVKNGARLYLKIKTNDSKVRISVQVGISFVFGVINFWVDPLALVVRVVNFLGLFNLLYYPRDISHLVLWVINHWGLPLAIHFIVPVVRFLSLRVGDVLRLVPVLGLAVLRVIDLLTLIPVVGDFLGWQKVPVSLELSTLNLLVVDLHFIGVVRANNQGVQMADFFFHKHVLSLVGKNDMDLLSSWAANDPTKHDVVRTLSMHFGLVKIAGEHFDVSSSTVDILFMFHCELDYQGFAFIRKFVKLGGKSIKAGILGGLNT
ncbi:hypothetical protein EGW08_020264, partial [Elysia chlorotica]